MPGKAAKITITERHRSWSSFGTACSAAGISSKALGTKLWL